MNMRVQIYFRDNDFTFFGFENYKITLLVAYIIIVHVANRYSKMVAALPAWASGLKYGTFTEIEERIIR